MSVVRTARLLRREDLLRGVPVRATARTLAGNWTTPRQLAGATRLHLGCGEHLLPGWANIDLIGFPGVIPWNLAGPLPVKDGSIDFVYSEHFIEHVSLDVARQIFSECHRVLRPGGVARISTPDLRMLLTEYDAGRTGEWTDVDWRPATPCRMVNEGMRSWGHEFIFDFDEMELQLHEAGFSTVTRVEWQQSAHAELRELECRPFHGEVIVEATK